jgi:hypothetical protein
VSVDPGGERSQRAAQADYALDAHDGEHLAFRWTRFLVRNPLPVGRTGERESEPRFDATRPVPARDLPIPRALACRRDPGAAVGRVRLARAGRAHDPQR